MLTADLSPSELSLLGIEKINKAENELAINPNPVRTNATIRFTTAQSGEASVAVYDMNGKRISVLYNGTTEKGLTKTVPFETSHLAAGTYIGILKTATGIKTQKINILK